MKILDKLFGKEPVRKGICSNCGKIILPFFTRKHFFSFLRVTAYPTEYIPDTLGAICPYCGSLLCHDCRYTQEINKCPNCGSLFVSVKSPKK